VEHLRQKQSSFLERWNANRSSSLVSFSGVIFRLASIAVNFVETSDRAIKTLKRRFGGLFPTTAESPFSSELSRGLNERTRFMRFNVND